MRKIWTTRGARLEASRRLSRSGQASRWVVTIASLSLVALSISLGSPVFQLAGETRQLAELISAIGAVSILLVTTIEYGKAYELRADRHHRASIALNRLYDAHVGNTEKPLDELVARYHEVLEAFPENHEPIDYHMFAVRHSKDFDANMWDHVAIRGMWHLAGQRAWVMVVLVGGLFLALARSLAV